MKRSSIMAAITGLLFSNGVAHEVKPAKIWFDDTAHWGTPAVRHPSRKTTTAAQLKRAAKKRANVRARSKK